MYVDHADIVSQQDLNKRALNYNIWRGRGVPERYSYHAHPKDEHPCSPDN